MKYPYLALAGVVVLYAGAITGIVVGQVRVAELDARLEQIVENEQERYDEGMRAGVEYQEWFCKNPEYAG
jgi:hypothetical protein